MLHLFILFVPTGMYPNSSGSEAKIQQIINIKWAPAKMFFRSTNLIFLWSLFKNLTVKNFMRFKALIFMAN